MHGSNLQNEGVGCRQETNTSDTPADTAATVGGVKALAQTLGVNRSTIYEWLKLPGHPGGSQASGYDVAAWREFSRQIGSKTEVGQGAEKSLLQAEELRVIIEDRKFRLAVKMGDYTHNSQIGVEIAELVQEAKAVLLAKFERELPPLYTTDAAANRRLNSEALDEICERLSRPLPSTSAS